MKKTFKIREVIDRYKFYVRYRNIIQETQPEIIEHYKFIEMGTLRELAILKAESPNSYRFACVLNKLLLN